MARLYVYAFTDTPLESWTDDGRTIDSVSIEEIVVVCERRTDLPPVTEVELRRQHSIVLQIADRVPAVLPARFGSLLGERELADLVHGRQAVLRRALDRVRRNVQMTVRIPIGKTRTAPAARPATGRAYLQQRRTELSAPMPPRARTALQCVKKFVKQEERRTSIDDGVLTVYQLVGRADLEKYVKALGNASVAGMRVTGPWPPFAFVPDLLHDEEDT